MSDFMMLMKSGNAVSQAGDWDTYIKKVTDSGMFRGGSVLANGQCISKHKESACSVTGFMRFEADDISQIRALLEGNPVYEVGGEVELLELVMS